MKELKLIRYKSKRSKRSKIIEKSLSFDLQNLNYEDASFLVSNTGPVWDDIIVDGSRYGLYGERYEKLRVFIYDKHTELSFLKRFDGITTSDHIKTILLELHSRVCKLENKNQQLSDTLDNLTDTFRSI